MKKKNKIIISSVVLAGIAGITGALIWGNTYALSYSTIISLYLNQDTYKIENTNSDEEVEDIYKSEFTSSRKLVREEAKYAETIQSEGSVLLINKNNALPNSSLKNITLFGTGSVDFIYGGSGAGSISTLGTPTLKESFENHDFSVNPTVWDLYDTGSGSTYRRNTSYLGYKVGEAPTSIFTEQDKASFENYKDAAIVVISRPGMEGGDLSSTTIEDPLKHSLQLSQNEIDTIKLAKNSGFGKVIVLLNTLNSIELNELKDLDVDACLWVGAGGQKGLNAIPKMITGDLAPSGRLVDTYATDALSSPAYQNSGSFAFSNVTTRSQSKYITYNEGIYVGYKYYETRYEDAVLNQGNAGSYNYTSEVQYPFGYGLSYTTFDHSNFQMTETQDSFEFTVKVKNTGNISSKDVVEIYLQSPYTDYDKTNGVEKSSVKLAGFAKTDELAPNQTQNVKVSVDKQELASYDYKKAKTYIVDDGTYYFADGANAHDALNNILAKKGKTASAGMDYNGNSGLVASYTQAEFDNTTYTTSATGEKITNKLSSADLATYDSSVKYLTRNNWTDTFPQAYEATAGSRTAVASDQLIADLAVPTVSENESDYTMPTTDTIDKEIGQLSLVSMNGLSYDNKYWDSLLNQMTKEEMYTLARTGGYSTGAVKSVNKPSTIDKDGPAGISSTLVGGKGAFGYPVECVISSSWNVELAKRVGELIGEDGLYTKTSGWYAPSMNIHRTPFSGRNFEYFSEDGFISGKFGASMVEGCQSKGVYAYIKHFAFNDQETNRGGVATFLNEQAAREIYLKPFMTSVEEGHAHGLMVAMNRVGATWVGHSKALITDILRNEWGFEGTVITDQASFFTDYIGDFRPTLMAGVDLMLCTKTDLWQIENYDSSPMYITALRRAAKNIMFTVANSNAMNGQSASTRIVPIRPTWQKWLITGDCVLFAGLGVGVFFTVRSLIKALKIKEEK